MNLCDLGGSVHVLLAASFASGGLAWAIDLPIKPLSELASPEFRVRQSAELELLEWARRKGQSAMVALFRESGKSFDPEVRERCLSVLRVLVDEQYMTQGEGFIGVSMMNEVAEVPGDPKSRNVIRITQIIGGSAAEKFGLKVNDLIVGLDGAAWYDQSAAEALTRKIKAKKPGTEVVLEILRNQKLEKVAVVLGKRLPDPEFQWMGGMPFDAAGAEKRAQERYFRQWMAEQNE